MTDIFETGSSWLEDQRHQRATRSVTYRRGGESVELAATIGRTVFEVDDGSGVLERIESRDFLVLTAELVLAGTQALPQRGDQIRETAGGKTYVYEVMAPAGQLAWRFSDPYRKTLRIHTKQIDIETP